MLTLPWRIAALSFSVVLLGLLGPVEAASGWTNFGAVTELNQQPAAGPGSELVFLSVAVTSNPSDPGACTVRDGFYFAVSDDRRKRMFAMLMLAQASGRQVRVYVTTNCHSWGYAELDGVIVQ